MCLINLICDALPSFLPTKENKELWRLQKEVDMLIMKIITDREAQNQKNNTYVDQKDLLQTILEGVASATDGKGVFKHGNGMNQLIVDICKNFYFAGSESSALAVIWTLLLLALHPDWQQRVRSEIMETYDNMLPHSFHDMSKFQKLKAVSTSLHHLLFIYQLYLLLLKVLNCSCNCGCINI